MPRLLPPNATYSDSSTRVPTHPGESTRPYPERGWTKVRSAWLRLDLPYLLARALATVTLYWATCPDLSQAQGYADYVQVPFPQEYQDAKKINELIRAKNQIVQGSSLDSSGRQTLENYYLKFLFPAMTQAGFASRIADARVEFLKDFASAQGDVHKALLSLGVRGSRGLLGKSDFHPAARVNAVMILGALNDSEGDPRTGEPPVPVKQITKILTDLVRNDKEHEAVRAAALVELERHARLRGAPGGRDSLTDAERTDLRSLALELIGATEPTAQRSKAAQEWLRGKAIEIAGDLRDAGPQRETYQALLILTQDRDTGLDLRCEALRGLSQLSLDPQKVDNVALTYAIGRLMADALEYEIMQMLDSREGPQAMPGPGPERMPRSEGGRPGYGEPMEDDSRPKFEIVDARTTNTRRRLLTRLAIIKAALGDGKTGGAGLAQFLKPPAVKDFTGALDALTKELKDTESMMEKLGAGLVPILKQLDEKYPKKSSRRGGDGDERRGPRSPEGDRGN